LGTVYRALTKFVLLDQLLVFLQKDITLVLLIFILIISIALTSYRINIRLL
jgi:hypothetical protein